MPTNESITISILAKDLASGNVNKVTTQLNTLGKQGGLAGNALKSAGSAIGTMVNPAFLAVAAVGALTGAIGLSIKNAIDEEKNIAQMGAALQANIPNWDGNTTAIEGVISANEKLAFSDDAQRNAMSQLVTRTHDVAKAQNLMRQAMDLARLKQIDLTTATAVIGKVYAGNFTAAQKMGIAIRKGATATEALAQIQKAAAGQAEAYANTTAGAMEGANIAIQDASETLGAALMPIVKEFAYFVRDTLAPGIQTLIGMIGGLGTVFNDLHRFIDPNLAASQDFEAAIKKIGTEAHLTSTEIQAIIDKHNGLLSPTEANIKVTGDFTRSLFYGSDALKVMQKGEEDKAAADKAAADATNLAAQALVDQEVATKNAAAAAQEHAAAVAALAGSQLEWWKGLSSASTSTAIKEKANSDATANAILEGDNKIRAANKALEESYLSLGSNFKDTLQQMKQDAKTGLADIRFTMKHDGHQTKAILERDMKEAVRLRNKALATGNTRALSEIDAYIADVQAKMDNLNMTQTINVVTSADLGGGHHAPGAGRARGGPVLAGETYTVGEHGPETLVMGGTAGTIIPSGAGGSTFVYAPQYSTASEAEARRFAEALTPHLARAMRTANL